MQKKSNRVHSTPAERHTRRKNLQKKVALAEKQAKRRGRPKKEPQGEDTPEGKDTPETPETITRKCPYTIDSEANTEPRPLPPVPKQDRRKHLIQGALKKKLPLPKKLTPKMERFVDYYLLMDSGIKAAIVAGYSEHTAGAIAHQLLQKPQVQACIALRKVTIENKVSQYAHSALESVRETSVQKKNKELRLAASLEILKMNGQYTQKVDVKTTSLSVDVIREVPDDQLERFINKFLQIRADSKHEPTLVDDMDEDTPPPVLLPEDEPAPPEVSPPDDSPDEDSST